MTQDLAELQQTAISRGFVKDFAIIGNSLPEVTAQHLRIVDTITLDTGTDPGDDVTMYLIGGPGENGYLIVSDSFHADPAKAAFIDEMLARPDR